MTVHLYEKVFKKLQKKEIASLENLTDEMRLWEDMTKFFKKNRVSVFLDTPTDIGL